METFTGGVLLMHADGTEEWRSIEDELDMPALLDAGTRIVFSSTDDSEETRERLRNLSFGA